MRAWVFRNRRRLEELLDRRVGREAQPRLAPPPSEPARNPRVVELQPARRPGR